MVMRFRTKPGETARRFVFDRSPRVQLAPSPHCPPSAAALDNPYGRYYSSPRSREDLIKNKK